MARPAIFREFYEHEADLYVISPEAEPAFRHRRTLVWRLLPRERIARILDVGCGDGSMSADLAVRARTVGTDLSRQRVLHAAARAPAARFVQSSIYELPFADGSFPLVVCTDLLEHLDEPERAMRELARVSSRWVIVSVPYSITIEKTLCPHCLKSYFLYGHQHSFGREGLVKLADASGLSVERFEHVIPMFECRRYKYFPPLKWLIWGHFRNSGTLGARLARA
jgi:ubiquinone/menaquinone biosynthesis C-methylase UbiE